MSLMIICMIFVASSDVLHSNISSLPHFIIFNLGSSMIHFDYGTWSNCWISVDFFQPLFLGKSQITAATNTCIAKTCRASSGYNVLFILVSLLQVMWNKLVNFAQDERQAQADMCVVIIMSHGLHCKWLMDFQMCCCLLFNKWKGKIAGYSFWLQCC